METPSKHRKTPLCMNHDYSEVPGRQQQEGMAHPAAIYRTVRRAQGSGGSSLQHLRPKPAGWVREGSRRLGCARGVRNASTSGPATESSPPPQAHRFQWAARIGTEFSRHLLGSLHFYDEKVASYWAGMRCPAQAEMLSRFVLRYGPRPALALRGQSKHFLTGPIGA